ncbi:MAG: hypothetical protein K2Y21_06840 [Phycisphaerales bacterium]|nr:hypothetical protein [Phycisphaerales bacterium]
MVLEHLQRPDFTLETCAEWLRTDLPSLCAFLTSDRGLALLAHTELAQAIHIRAIAIAQLPRVIDAMTYALEDFAHTCRNVPINPKSMQALEFVERAKDTARRNGQLLLRLAHFSPRPLRSYAPPRPALTSPERQRVGPAFTNPTRKRGSTDVPQAHPIPDIQPLPASTSPERQRVGPAFTNPTRKRGATDAPQAHPTPDIQPLPASTSPERKRVGVFSPMSRSTPAVEIPVPLTISASTRKQAPSLREITSPAHHPTTGPPRPDTHRVSHN